MNESAIDQSHPAMGKELSWLWPHRIARRSVNVIAGVPGVGKSLLTCTIAAYASSGRIMPGMRAACPLTSVLMLNDEDDVPTTIRPRLLAAGADLTRIGYLRPTRLDRVERGARRGIDLHHDAAELGDNLGGVPAPRMLIVDVFTGFLDSLGANKERGIKKVLFPLANLAWELDTTVLLVSHLQKTKSGRGVQIIGSIAFQEVVKHALIVEYGPQGDVGCRRIVPVATEACRDSSEQLFSIRQHPTLPVPYIEWGRTAPCESRAVEWDTRGRPARINASAKSAIHQRLVLGPATFDELYELLPKPKPHPRTLRRFIKTHYFWVNEEGTRRRRVALHDPLKSRSD